MPNMDSWIFAFFALCYFMLMIYGIYDANRKKWWTAANFLLLVTFGLVYDNGIIALGKWVGIGPILEQISFFRFVFHALFTPTLVLFAYYAICRSGAVWARKKAVRIAAYLLTAALTVLELITETLHVKLKPEEEYGALRYVPVESGGGPPIMVLITIIPLIVAGFIIWRKLQWVWMLAGSVIMTVGSAVPLELNSAAITNAFEFILIVSLWATKWFLDDKPISYGNLHRKG